jgi:transposase InsO family protein
MEERTKFILAHNENIFSVSELCARFSISRNTAYRWINRYQSDGLPGLQEYSRAPHSCPHQTPPEVERLLVECREKHPYWGPKKLKAYLSRRHDVALPATSTIGSILRRNGLIKPRRRRRPSRHPGAPVLTTTAPNQVWTADFKGEFKTKDGIYCYPLTICDAHTRFIFDVRGRYSVKQKTAIPVFRRLFKEHGLPVAMRTDNGAPFATVALCGLSKLSVWWIKLGIAHQRIEPGQPQQNGRHERMHRTLKRETARPPRSNMRRQQKRFDQWRDEFNNERPHESLGDETPASLYQASPREMPSRLHGPDYPAHFTIRRVSTCGTFRLDANQIFLSQTLNTELIGLEETGDGIWDIYFHDVLLARLDERTYTIHAAAP